MRAYRVAVITSSQKFVTTILLGNTQRILIRRTVARTVRPFVWAHDVSLDPKYCDVRIRVVTQFAVESRRDELSIRSLMTVWRPKRVNAGRRERVGGHAHSGVRTWRRHARAFIA